MKRVTGFFIMLMMSFFKNFVNRKLGVFIALWTKTRLRSRWHWLKQNLFLASEHLTIYTGVLAHIALAYPEPTLFFFVPTYAVLIRCGTLLFMALRRNREVELHT